MNFCGFKKYKKSGAVYVIDRAVELGFKYGSLDWFNLGQGTPEEGEIEHGIERVYDVKINQEQHGYAPISGLKELRENVASVYNNLFRVNKKSKYTYKNINISGGGRMAISRVVASMKNIKVGYFVPDYPSYEGILDCFNNVDTVPIFLDDKNGFAHNIEKIKNEVEKKKIKALILSNPSNPTGNVIMDNDLEDLVKFARKKEIYLIIDEFYFNFIYDKKFKLVSSAEFILDVEKDPVIIISGLSKAWRYSGWRICWAIGPAEIMDFAERVGSFLDGGANNPLQKVSIKIVNVENILKESKAIQYVFGKKRDYVIKKLEKLGITTYKNTAGSFYVWANIENLPKEINDGMRFFEELLKEKVIIVPGRFFDLNPSNDRIRKNFKKYIRLSYGPEMNIIESGLNKMEKVINKF